jgi:hypothetical protein
LFHYTANCPAARQNSRLIAWSIESKPTKTEEAMDSLDDIKRRADSWYDLMLAEVGKAVEKAFGDAARPPDPPQDTPR